jgi:hypothetical protein
MVRRVHLAVSAVVLAAATACSSDDPAPMTLQDCLREESVGYAAMEAVARTSLIGVPHVLQPSGACEDTGIPRTGVHAAIQTWPDRSVAHDYFERRGWEWVDGRLTSPDGLYSVHATTTTRADSTGSLVTLAFRELVDDAAWE